MSDEIQGSGEGEIGGVTGGGLPELPRGWQWETRPGYLDPPAAARTPLEVAGRGPRPLVRVAFVADQHRIAVRIPPLMHRSIPWTLLEWIAEAIGVPLVRDEVEQGAVKDPVTLKWRGTVVHGPDDDGIVWLSPGDWIAPELGITDTVHRVVDVVDSGLRRAAFGPGDDAPAPYYSVGVRLGELLAVATDGDAEAAARVLEEWAGAVLEWAQSPDLYDAIEELRPAIDAMLEPEGPVRLPVDSIRRAIATLQWRIGRLEAFEAAAINHVDELAAALVYLPRGSREWEALGTALDRFAEAIPDRLGQDDAARYWETREEIAAAPTQGRMSAPDADALRVLLEHLNAGDHTPESVRCAVTRLVDVAVSDPVPPGWEDPYPVEAERLATRILAMVNRSAERE